MDIDYAAGRITYTHADMMIEYIKQNDLSLEWIIETHVHADHLSAAPYIQDQLDDARNEETDAMLSEKLRGELGQFLPLQGTAALEARDQTIKALRKHVADLAVRAESPVQREQYARISRARLSDATARVEGHYFGQLQSHRVEKSRARTDALVRDSIESYGTDGWEVYRGQLEMQVRKTAELEGYSEERTEELLHEKRNQVHGEVLQGLIDAKDTEGARHYLESYGKEIEPKVKRRAQQIVKSADIDERSTRKAMDIEKQVGRMAEGPSAEVAVGGVRLVATTWQEELRQAKEGKALNRSQQPWNATQKLSAALDEVDRQYEEGVIDSAALRDATIARLRSTFGQESQFEAEREQRLLDEGQQWLVENRGSGATLDALAPSKREEMKAAGVWNRLKQWEAQGGKWIATEVGNAALMDPAGANLLQYETKEQLYSAYRQHMNDRGLEEITAHWRKLRGMEAPGDALVIDRGLVIRKYARDSGIQDGDAAAKEGFELAVYQKANALAGPGGKVTNALFEEAAKLMAEDRIISGGKPVPSSAVTPDARNEAHVMTSSGRQVFLKNVPADTWLDLRARLSAINDEIRSRNASLPPSQRQPLRPEGLQAMADLWEQDNIERRAESRQVADKIRSDSSRTVRLAYRQLHRLEMYDDDRVRDRLLNVASESRVRGGMLGMHTDNWIKDLYGLSDEDWQQLLTLAEVGL